MYQHIVVAADGSDNSFRAAQEAAKFASLNHGSHVTIVYVVNYDKTKTEVLHANSTESLYLERRKKLARVEQLLKEQQISYRVEILKGTPGVEIVQFVNNNDVDLVVIGSRGLNSLQEMVLGSVSHKVMKRVHCPALIVK